MIQRKQRTDRGPILHKPVRIPRPDKPRIPAVASHLSGTQLSRRSVPAKKTPPPESALNSDLHDVFHALSHSCILNIIRILGLLRIPPAQVRGHILLITLLLQ